MPSNRFGKFKCFYPLLAFYFAYYYVYHIPCKYTVAFKIFENNAHSVSKFESRKIKRDVNKGTKKDLKYILVWTNQDQYIGVGQNVFINAKCAHTNCYVTADRSLLPSVTRFDVVYFSGLHLANHDINKLPKQRSPHQKYVFATAEAAAYYPVCWKGYDGFFNWTWTYKLNSDARWGYIVIRNRNGKQIGPRKNMHWIKYENMLPVSKDLETILRKKNKTAAWIVSHCDTLGKREGYVRQLQRMLKSKYNRTVNVFGKCGPYKCSNSKCNEMLRNDYHFYLSFENAFSEDYVTEKLLRPLQNNAIPIVYGGANYSRFLPEKSYINAVDLSCEELADKMYALISNFDDYLEYFRWKNHYYYDKKSESPKTDDFCSLCELINNKRKVETKKVYTDFRTWWNEPRDCK